MKRLFPIVAITLFAVSLTYLFTGCASILDGTEQEISIASTPEDAHVEIKTLGGIKIKEGKTPLNIELGKDEDYKVTVSLEGYEENEVFLSGEINPTVWGNILCGGVIGFIIDFSNGAAYDLEPDMIHVDLVQVVGSNSKTEKYLIMKMLDDRGEVQTIVSPFKEKIKI